MSTIHFVTGIKGGVGKSMCCRTLTQYLLDKNIPFTGVECDRDNPDVGRAYKTCYQSTAIFSEGVEEYEYSVNDIFNLALEHETVLVNLPAQIETPFTEWFSNNDVFEVARDEDVRFVLWFVTDGNFDSVKLLYNSLVHFKESLSHVVVYNRGLNQRAWEELDVKEVQSLFRLYHAQRMDLPAFRNTRVRQYMDQHQLSFAAAKEDAQLNPIEKQNIIRYLRKAYQAIDPLAMFSGSTSNTSTEEE